MKTSLAERSLAALLCTTLLVVVSIDLHRRAVGRERLRADVDPASMALLDAAGGQRIGGFETFVGSLSFVELDGFGAVETEVSRKARPFRHGLAPESVLVIRSQQSRASVRLNFFNLVPGQTLRVAFNDAILETVTELPAKSFLAREYVLDLRPGAQNRFVIAYARDLHTAANPPPAAAATAASPPIVGTFFGLDLRFH